MDDGQFYGMSEEKIKIKADLSIFFLVGPISSKSEESSTIKYRECALIVQIVKAFGDKSDSNPDSD